MIKNFFAAFTAMLLIQSQAHALSVSFVQPDGIVGPTDSIDVMIRVTADNDFHFDGTDVDGGFGLDPAIIPTEGLFIGDSGAVFLPFDQITGAFTSVSYVCSGSFSDGGDSVCPPGSEYDFDFSFDGTGFGGRDVFSMTAGDSEDFLFGTFTPLDGSAAPGEYNFFGANITVLFLGVGTDEFGNVVDMFSSVTLASTCVTGDTSCDFSRTVVPVPGAVWLFSAAIGCLVGVRRRRTTG